MYAGEPAGTVMNGLLGGMTASSRAPPMSPESMRVPSDAEVMTNTASLWKHVATYIAVYAR